MGRILDEEPVDGWVESRRNQILIRVVGIKRMRRRNGQHGQAWSKDAPQRHDKRQPGKIDVLIASKCQGVRSIRACQGSGHLRPRMQRDG